MPRHSHLEFIRCLNTVERALPQSLRIRAVLDNLATRHPRVLAGSPVTRAGPFIPPRRRPPGSMTARVSFLDDAPAYSPRRLPLTFFLVAYFLAAQRF